MDNNEQNENIEDILTAEERLSLIKAAIMKDLEEKLAHADSDTLIKAYQSISNSSAPLISKVQLVHVMSGLLGSITKNGKNKIKNFVNQKTLALNLYISSVLIKTAAKRIGIDAVKDYLEKDELQEKTVEAEQPIIIPESNQMNAPVAEVKETVPDESIPIEDPVIPIAPLEPTPEIIAELENNNPIPTIPEEHPMNVLTGLKTIISNKAISIEASILGGVVKVKDTKDALINGINTFYHTKKNLICSAPKNAKDKIKNAFYLSDEKKNSLLGEKKSIQDKIDAYKEKLRKNKTVQPVENTPTPPIAEPITPQPEIPTPITTPRFEQDIDLRNTMVEHPLPPIEPTTTIDVGGYQIENKSKEM